VALKLCAGIHHDDFGHSKNACPCGNKGVPHILRGFVVIASNLANELESSAPTYTVEPIVQRPTEVLDLNKVKAHHMVEAISPRNCSWSACFWLLVGFTSFTREILSHPGCNFWFSISTPKQSSKVCIQRMSSIVMSNLQVSKLLLIWNESDCGRWLVLIAVGLSIFVDNALFW
jgi:hypothetical protein